MLKKNIRQSDLPKWLLIGKTSFDEAIEKFEINNVIVNGKQIEFTTIAKNGQNVKVTLYFKGNTLGRIKWNFNNQNHFLRLKYHNIKNETDSITPHTMGYAYGFFNSGMCSKFIP